MPKSPSLKTWKEALSIRQKNGIVFIRSNRSKKRIGLPGNAMIRAERRTNAAATSSSEAAKPAGLFLIFGAPRNRPVSLQFVIEFRRFL